MKKQTKKGILLSILFASMYLQTMSQNYCITNQFNFGGGENDAPCSIIKIADGYVISGYTNSHDGNFNVPHNHDVDGFIAKFDFNNNLIWQHTYGGKNHDDFFNIKSTDDRGFIAAGETCSNEYDVSGHHGGRTDAWVVKFDSLGILQWQHCYGGKGDDYPYEINVVPGGYQIVGATTSNNNGDVPANHGDYDAWLLNISSTGNVVSSYCYGGSGEDEMRSIVTNTNGTSTFQGSTYSNDGQVSGNHGNRDIWLVNIDNYNGNIIWQKCIGGSALDNPHEIARTVDGNIVLNIASNSSDGDFTGSPSGCSAGFTAKLLKVNPETGVVIWNRNYPHPNRCTMSLGALVTTDGGILSMGTIFDNPIDSDHDGYIFKIDADGNMLWDKILGGSKSENVIHWKTGIEINNQYLIPFTSKSKDGDILNPLGGADGWIVTLGTGCSQRLATETESNLSNEVAIFPNPVTNTTSISFTLSQSQKVSLKIFDVSGRLVSTLADKIFDAGENELVWNAAEVNAGIYFLRMQSAGNLETEKLIVAK
ncbi:MAG: T9SS type A sorting domain-containing protein [Bacteroidia bacterium]|nr:T9SS type A sorting domain-containing protein [Bacteroidia bacterium]